MVEVVVVIYAGIRAAEMVDMDYMDNLTSTFDDINDDALLAMDHSMRVVVAAVAVAVVAVAVAVAAAIVVHAPGEAMQYFDVR